MLPSNPLADMGSGGSGSTSDDDSIDTDESIAQGEVINDVRGQVAGHDDDIDTGYAGADEDDYDIETVDAPTGSDDTDGTLIDPDPSDDGDDVVGVVTSDEAVSVTTQNDDGGTETTTTERGSGNDPVEQAENDPAPTPNNDPVPDVPELDELDGAKKIALAVVVGLLALVGLGGS